MSLQRHDYGRTMYRTNFTQEQTDHNLSLLASIYCQFATLVIYIIGMDNILTMAFKGIGHNTYAKQGAGERGKKETTVPDAQLSCKRKLYTSDKCFQPKRRSTEGSSKEDDAGTPPPPQSGRKRRIHDGHSCGDCVVWLTLSSGLGETYKDKHATGVKTRHPQERADDFNKYLSVNGQNFRLNADSCMCNACYQDCVKFASSPAAVKPRWVNVHKDITNHHQNHCTVCHSETHLLASPCKSSPCKGQSRWGPLSWKHGFTTKFWTNFFHSTRPKPFALNLEENSKLCHKHYMEIYNKITRQSCRICNSNNSETWHMLFENANNVEKQLHTQQQDITLSPVDWICKQCHDSVLIGKRPSDPDKEFCESCFIQSVRTIEKKGYIMRKELIAMFSQRLISYIPRQKPSEIIKSFDRMFTTHIKDYPHIGKYFHDKQLKSIGSVLYDTKQISSSAIVQIYSTIYELELRKKSLSEWERSGFKTSDITTMLERQVELFTSAEKNVDYRQIFDNAKKDENSTYLFDSFLHKPLVEFFIKIVSPRGHAYGKKSEKVNHKDALKLQMVLAILCNILNKRCILIQTLIGLTLFAGGVRNKITDILCSFGLTCSSNKINSQAHFWSQQRNATDELNPQRFWRISFDNLNFKRKFAKTFQFGADVTGRMLNLITSQVSHTIAPTPTVNSIPSQKAKLEEKDFFLSEDSAEGETWTKFVTSLISTAALRLPKLKTLKTTFLQDLEPSFPSSTPPTADNVVYTRIEASQASSVEDVSSFLEKLKSDLKIGEPGYPSSAVVCGDQQTYSIMKNLMTKFPDTFKWIMAMPGDWHLLKLASETLRDLLWDGGLHDLAKLCQHHKEIHQWRDIHRVLSGLQESLMYQMVDAWEKACKKDNITWDAFLKAFKDNDNKDDISKFWAGILEYLNAYIGYFFAMRSGNWHLRNACLPKLSELFFSFSHHKYEELVCQSMKDTMKLPSAVIAAFINGEWTVSATGKPYHNMAMDEAHESLINKRTKELTTRPSEFSE